jgi:hypothetical protein
LRAKKIVTRRIGIAATVDAELHSSELHNSQTEILEFSSEALCLITSQDLVPSKLQTRTV